MTGGPSVSAISRNFPRARPDAAAHLRPYLSLSGEERRFYGGAPMFDARSILDILLGGAGATAEAGRAARRGQVPRPAGAARQPGRRGTADGWAPPPRRRRGRPRAAAGAARSRARRGRRSGGAAAPNPGGRPAWPWSWSASRSRRTHGSQRRQPAGPPARAARRRTRRRTAARTVPCGRRARHAAPGWRRLPAGCAEAGAGPGD